MAKPRKSQKQVKKNLSQPSSIPKNKPATQISEATSDNFTKTELLWITATVGGGFFLITCLLAYLRLKH